MRNKLGRSEKQKGGQGGQREGGWAGGSCWGFEIIKCSGEPVEGVEKGSERLRFRVLKDCSCAHRELITKMTRRNEVGWGHN